MNSVQNWLQIDLCAERSTQKQHNNNVVGSESHETSATKDGREMTPQLESVQHKTGKCVDAQGARALSEALMVNTTLAVLNLSRKWHKGDD